MINNSRWYLFTYPKSVFNIDEAYKHMQVTKMEHFNYYDYSFSEDEKCIYFCSNNPITHKEFVEGWFYMRFGFSESKDMIAVKIVHDNFIIKSKKKKFKIHR
jgi:hypothetical protein